MRLDHSFVSLDIVPTRSLGTLFRNSYYWTGVSEKRVAGPEHIDHRVWENIKGRPAIDSGSVTPSPSAEGS